MGRRGYVFALLAPFVAALVAAPTRPAGAEPATVTMAGSFQQELACTADWLSECALTQLSLDQDDGVWQASFDLPAGNWEYKAALNGSWVEN